MVALISLTMGESDERLDPSLVIANLLTEVPALEVAEGDQMQIEIKRILASSISDKARAKVVDKLRRNALLYGPSIGFTIPCTDSPDVRGHVRPVDLVFLCDELPDKVLWARLADFCKRIGRGTLSIEQS